MAQDSQSGNDVIKTSASNFKRNSLTEIMRPVDVDSLAAQKYRYRNDDVEPPYRHVADAPLHMDNSDALNRFGASGVGEQCNGRAIL